MSTVSGREGGSGRRVIAFTSLAHFANDGESFFIPVLIDLVAIAYGLDVLMVALANVLFWLSTAAGAIALGPLIDRRSLQAGGMAFGILVLSVGLILFSVALAGVSVTFLLLGSSVVAGFGSSFYHPTGASILQSHYRGRRLGRYLGINGSAGSVGRAAYPTLLLLLGSALASNVLSVQAFGLVGVAFAVVVYAGVRGYGAAPVGQSGDGGSARKEGAVTPGLALLTSISFVRSLAFYGIVSFIPEYISFERGAGAGLSLGVFTTLMYVGAIAGQLFFGKLVEDHDRRLILALSTVSSAVFLYLYLITSGTLSLVVLVLFGFANFSSFPIFMSMASDYVRKETTTGNAIVWNLGNTGGRAAGPLVVGLIAAGGYSNLTFAFEVSLLAALVSALATMKLPRPAASKGPMFG